MIQLKENIFLETISINKDKNELYDLIVTDHKNLIYSYDQYNFKLDDKYKEFTEDLYSKFLSFCESLFGKLELLEQNKRDCWAYVSNKDSIECVVHNHLRTAVLNGVYYLNIPDENSGSLDFFDDNMNIIYTHYPKESELLLFPPYLLHKPNMNYSDKYRIAINVEIICNLKNIEKFVKKQAYAEY
jgi:hypothetical protein